jgi:Tfp pilus tip-associated adhesin PilY1
MKISQFLGSTIAIALTFLFSYTKQFSALNTASKIDFEYSYTSHVPNRKLLSFKAEAISHHNFSSLVTGILDSYKFNHGFKVMTPKSLDSAHGYRNSTDGLNDVQNADGTLSLININDFSSEGYVEFVKDFFQRMLTKKASVGSCEDYFPKDKADAKNCEFYDKSQTDMIKDFVIKNDNLRQNYSSYIYVNKDSTQGYDLQYTNSGSITIMIFNIADRVLVSILIILGSSTLLIAWDIFRLYRKKNKTRNRINRLKKAI